MKLKTSAFSKAKKLNQLDELGYRDLLSPKGRKLKKK
jgi:hypothetical protein